MSKDTFLISWKSFFFCCDSQTYLQVKNGWKKVSFLCQEFFNCQLNSFQKVFCFCDFKFCLGRLLFEETDTHVYTKNCAIWSGNMCAESDKIEIKMGSYFNGKHSI